MPVTTAVYNAHPDRTSSLLADIEQVTLDGDVLISLTSHFHKLFNLGLSEYGQPEVANMYVLFGASTFHLTGYSSYLTWTTFLTSGN